MEQIIRQKEIDNKFELEEKTIPKEYKEKANPKKWKNMKKYKPKHNEDIEEMKFLQSYLPGMKIMASRVNQEKKSFLTLWLRRLIPPDLMFPNFLNSISSSDTVIFKGRFFT